MVPAARLVGNYSCCPVFVERLLVLTALRSFLARTGVWQRQG